MVVAVVLVVVVRAGVAGAVADAAPLQTALLALPAFEQSKCLAAVAEVAGDAASAAGVRKAKITIAL